MAVVYPHQVFHGYINPQRYVHGPIRFEYKGMWPAVRTKYFRDLSVTKTEPEAEVVIVNTMKSMLVSWSIKYPKSYPNKELAGQPIPITVETLQNEIMTHVRNRMLNIITWSSESDIDPDMPSEEALKEIERRSEMLQTEKTLDEMMAEADAAMLGN